MAVKTLCQGSCPKAKNYCRCLISGQNEQYIMSGKCSKGLLKSGYFYVLICFYFSRPNSAPVPVIKKIIPGASGHTRVSSASRQASAQKVIGKTDSSNRIDKTSSKNDLRRAFERENSYHVNIHIKNSGEF